MRKRTLLLASLAASAIGFIPVAASADVGIFLDVAPPDPRHEVIPAHRPGHVWQPGYWDWRNGRYVWVRERPGMHWHPNRWDHRPGRGYGDRDRDGIPNRYDRDRDGIQNRFDERPDNPYR